MEASDKGNRDIIRYLVNRIRRIKKCVDQSTVARVIQGDTKIVEEALRALLFGRGRLFVLWMRNIKVRL